MGNPGTDKTATRREESLKHQVTNPFFPPLFNSHYPFAGPAVVIVISLFFTFRYAYRLCIYIKT